MKYIRKYKLTVGLRESREETDIDGYEITPSVAATMSDLHVSFDIAKSDDSSKVLNSATVSIYNISDQTKRLIEKPDSVILLEAGWQDDSYGLIFQGDIVTYQHTRSGTDWITKITCADGYVGVRESITNKTFPPGSTVQSVLLDMFKGEPGNTVYYTAQSKSHVRPPSGLGLSIGDMTGLGLFDTYDNSFTVSKPTKQAIDDICYSHGLKWSIQDGRVYVTSAVGDTVYKYTVPLISEDTGLIGTPEKIKEGAQKRKNDKTPDLGYKFACTLNHELLPELFVRVVAEDLDVVMKIKKVKHKGAYEGGAWDTHVEAIIQDIE